MNPTSSRLISVPAWEERRNRHRGVVVEKQMGMLLEYLKEEDPHLVERVNHIIESYDCYCIGMRNSVRKIVGAELWEGFYMYYRFRLESIKKHRLFKEFCARQEQRIQLLRENPKDAPTIPPFPQLSSILNEDVTEIIFGFVDPKSMYEASKVSRKFRDALIPRQRNVTIAGFPSFEAFRRMNFASMELFVCLGSPLETSELLCVLANDCASYPNFTRLHVRCGLQSPRDDEQEISENALRLFRIEMRSRITIKELYVENAYHSFFR